MYKAEELKSKEGENHIPGPGRYVRPVKNGHFPGVAAKKINKTATVKSKDTGPEISLDYLYAQYCLQRGFKMASPTETCIHRWNESCWEPLDQIQFETDAYEYLSSTNLKSTTQAKAQTLVKVVPLALNSQKLYVPKRPINTDVIPLKNAYLVLKGDTPEFTISKPDPALGMKFTINAHLPEEYLSQSVYTPKPVPTDSLFFNFLETSLPDLEVRALCQEMMASTILQRNFQKATILMGEGSNGKGVLHKIMAAVHERTIAKELDRLNDSHDLENIVGASLILVDEIPEGRIHVQRFKSLVSRDIVTINPKGLKAFSYTPEAAWILNGNHQMTSRDQSYGFWRRTVTIPFNSKLTSKILNLSDKIVATELLVVIDWLLEGAIRIIRRGDLMAEEDYPKAVKDEILSAQLAANSILSFVDDTEFKIDVEGETWMEKSVVFADYEHYCSSNGLKPFNSKNFFKGLLKIAEKFKTPYKERQTTVAGGKRVRQISVSYQNSSQAPIKVKLVDQELDEIPYTNLAGK